MHKSWLQQLYMNVYRIAYLELRRINFIRNLLSVDAVKTQVCSLVLSRLTYCNSLLIGLPKYLIKRLQGVRNAAARSMLRTPRYEHISPLLQNLVACALCPTSLSGSGPQYLFDPTHIYTPAWSLRSFSDTRSLSTPNVKLKSYGQRFFAYHDPTTWNDLPFDLRHKDSLSIFKSAVKTHLFHKLT